MPSYTCPSCQYKTHQLFTCKDYSVSGDLFDIYECPHCSLRITEPQPDESQLYRYYQSESYVSHSDTKKGIINRLYHIVRKKNTLTKLNIVNRVAHNKKGNLLDIGCGSGYFLSVCHRHQWSVNGIEPNEQARNLAENRIHQHIYSSIHEPLNEGKKFDLITLWHVFEHLSDIQASAEQLKSLLLDQGIIVLAVPNYMAFDGQHYASHWAAYDVPRHLHHFSPTSMEYLLHQHNLRIEQIIPLRFDSYYVSMLSEQQKGSGKISQLIKGGYNGFRSNRRAAKTGNYSSLIYIIKKQ